jgi:hypothetical protein
MPLWCASAPYEINHTIYKIILQSEQQIRLNPPFAKEEVWDEFALRFGASSSGYGSPPFVFERSGRKSPPLKKGD